VNLKAHFSRFLAADPKRLHFAAHSHHLWPDVTFQAQQACWEDAARHADRKWDKILSEAYPNAQGHVAQVLGLEDPKTVAFGPNTHGFVLRLLSCLPAGRSSRILTSDSEFHSFARQIARLEEDARVQVTRVAAEPFQSFSARFATEATKGGHDMVYLSQVFYNSGYVVPDLPALVGAVPEQDTLVVIDGYHGYMALPTDLGNIAERAFYLAGGYKYAMSGEGVCFLHAPPGHGTRPPNTGWFAAFESLEGGGDGKLGYAPDGARFLGATFDPVGLYRLNAVMDWLGSLDITVAGIHEHVHGLQQSFVAELAGLGLEALHPGQLVVPLAEPNRGNFLTFRSERAGELHRQLLKSDIITDFRGDRLRFGFGLYHDEEDVAKLCHALGEVVA